MARFSDKIDRRFSYTNAADSAKPGYLKNKFDKIRRELAAKSEAIKIEVQAKVRRISK